MIWSDFVASNQASVVAMIGPVAGIIILLALAELVLKGFALYKAARLNEKLAFVTLLIFNTLGIYPAIYLYLKRKRRV